MYTERVTDSNYDDLCSGTMTCWWCATYKADTTDLILGGRGWKGSSLLLFTLNGMGEVKVDSILGDNVLVWVEERNIDR